MNDDLRFPIGRFEGVGDLSVEAAMSLVDQIASLPNDLRAALANLSDAQLATPYRPDGWSVAQVVHHLADSHMNAFIRCKLVLTEEQPTVKPYLQDEWAATADNVVAAMTSVTLLEALHQRWVALLRPVAAGDLQRTFVHPEHGRPMTLAGTVGLYAWHGRHHVAHITELRRREGW